jgi:DNA-binding Xre family transcriptional regulator
MGIVRFTVKEFAERKGIGNPFVLSNVTGINYATCYSLWRGKQQRVDVGTLAVLCSELECQPSDLLAYVANGKVQPPGRKAGRKKVGTRN